MADLPSLEELLDKSGLRDRAEALSGGLFRMQWGSAIVMLGASGQAVVAIAPLFKAPPVEQRDVFYRRLLEHNSFMGGMASFAIQPDGWVVLHAGRSRVGLDAHELATLVTGVGRFADDFDDKLIAEFYAPAEPAAATDNPAE
jgi:Tir chaperone protein (CesT) family